MAVVVRELLCPLTSFPLADVTWEAVRHEAGKTRGDDSEQFCEEKL